MPSLSILFTAALLSLGVTAADVPVFTLDCSSATGYPEACETHCFAAVCSSVRGGNDFRTVNKYLHYAKNSGGKNGVQPNPPFKVTEATYRRQAIGCGSSTCSTDFPGSSCDEFPYASTYDGGLGCLTSRYPGADPLATTGITHCADLDDNTAHGRAITTFYNSLNNGDRFQVGFSEANIDNAPACKTLRRNGQSACATLMATGRYEVVKKKAAAQTFCPDRPTLGHYRRSTPQRLTEEDLNEYDPENRQEVVWHSSVDAHGNRLLLPFSDGPLEVGTPVYHGIGNGTAFHSVVVG